MLPLRAVLFDLDGTLIDSIDHIVDCWQHVGRTCLGRELSREEILPTLGRTLMDAFQEIAPGRVDELLSVYRARQVETHDSAITLVPGTLEMLRALKDAGLKLAIVTSKGIPAATRAMELFGLAPFFEALVTFEDTERHKPHPDPVLAACRKLQIAPREAIYVGDAVFDIQAGRAAGAGTAAVTWGSGSSEELLSAGADYLLQDTGELPGLVAHLFAGSSNWNGGRRTTDRGRQTAEDGKKIAERCGGTV